MNIIIDENTSEKDRYLHGMATHGFVMHSETGPVNPPILLEGKAFFEQFEEHENLEPVGSILKRSIKRYEEKDDAKRT